MHWSTIARFAVIAVIFLRTQKNEWWLRRYCHKPSKHLGLNIFISSISTKSSVKLLRDYLISLQHLQRNGRESDCVRVKYLVKKKQIVIPFRIEWY